MIKTPLLALLLPIVPLTAQTVSLHSVTIDADDNVTVVYSKNFATCAHLYFSNSTCTASVAITHVQNIFCTTGTMVSVTHPKSAFVAGFEPGVTLRMRHGNNAGIVSSCVTIECDGTYGTGCAPIGGTAPSLVANDACPPAGSTLDLQIQNGTIGSLGVLGLGLARAQFPVFGCELLVGSLQGTVVVPIDASGNGAFTLPLPAGSAGFELTAQAFILDVNGVQGFTATNGMLARVR